MAELEAALATERARADELATDRDRLRERYRHLQLEVELMRRLVVAKAERVDTTQLELEFAAKLRELDRLAGLTPDRATDPEVGAASESSGRKKRSKDKPKGRRRLSELDVPEERIELTDPALELTHRGTWHDVHDVPQAVFEYVEVFCNRRRLLGLAMPDPSTLYS